jgi:hypothetical protein
MVCCASFWIGLFYCLVNVPCTTAQEVTSKVDVFPAFEKASVSFRIAPNIALSEERSEQLLKLLSKYPGTTDQISFFVGATHAPLNLEETEKRCLILKERMKRVRECGYESGINILCTMGFFNENMANTVGPEIGRCTDIHGSINYGRLCPNQENYREHVKKLYRILVEAEPDYIWIDDDVHLGGHCFCDSCVRLFSEETGTEYTRATLATRLNEPDVRKQWSKHNSDSITRLLTLIETTVHELRPGLRIGFMTFEHFQDRYDYERWAHALSGSSASEVLWRPGGGFWSEEPISAMCEKSRRVERQISLLPPNVRCIQPEIENFPRERLAKSAHIVVLEAGTYIAAGGTGAAFNVMTMEEEPLDDHEPLIAEICRWRPFYDLIVRHTGRDKLTGVFPYWQHDSWGIGASVKDFPEINTIGIPSTSSKEGKQGVTILLDTVFANNLPKETLETIFSEGVYLDVETLNVLNSRGFGELTGLELEQTIMVDSIERLTNHPLNGEVAGRTRDCRQSFWHAPAHLLKRTNPNAQILSERLDYSGEVHGECLSAIFENRLGGRVYVGGYHPVDWLFGKTKTVQTRQIMRWLSKDKISAYVDSYHRMNIWTRPTEESGGMSILLLNHSYDTAEKVAVCIKTKADRIICYDRSCQPFEITVSSKDEVYRRFEIPKPIAPWDMRLLVVQETE